MWRGWGTVGSLDIGELGTAVQQVGTFFIFIHIDQFEEGGKCTPDQSCEFTEICILEEHRIPFPLEHG